MTINKDTSYKTIGGATAYIVEVNVPGDYPNIGYTQVGTAQVIPRLWNADGEVLDASSDFNLVDEAPSAPIPFLVDETESFSANVTGNDAATMEEALLAASQADTRLLTRAEAMFLFETDEAFRTSVETKNFWVLAAADLVSDSDTLAWVFSGRNGDVSFNSRTNRKAVVLLARP